MEKCEMWDVRFPGLVDKLPGRRLPSDTYTGPVVDINRVISKYALSK